MGLTFSKRIKIAKGVSLNLSKSGVSLSLGVKGAKYNINSKGKSSVSLSLPGTGVGYRKSFSLKNVVNKLTNNEKPSKKATSKKQEADIAENEAIVQEYETFVEAIKSIHTVCEEEFDWKKVNSEKEPFKKGSIGPNEKEAQKAIDNYKPSFFDKLTKKDDDEEAKLKEALDVAKQNDDELYQSYEVRKEYAKRIQEQDLDAYLEVIDIIAPFDDLLELGSDFEVGIKDEKTMVVEFNVKSSDIIPDSAPTLLKSGKISEKKLTKTNYNELVKDYVCSTTIRIARDLFAILPLEYIIVHAQDVLVNTRTGIDEEFTILSVDFDRKTFDKVNFERIDPSDFVESFTHKMNYTKLNGFKEVERID